MPISSSSSAPLIVIVGATGNQGGSIVQALAESDRPYRIRGLTRDVTKPAAQKLANQGVETVNVILSVANADAVQKVFKGADFVFVVTSFWEHFDREREAAEGRMMVDAAKAAGVKLFIWSALESVSEVSKGKYIHVDHFDGKGEITAYAHASGIPLLIVQAGWYMTNFLFFDAMAATKEADGSYTLGLPVSADTVVPGIESPVFGPGTEVLASSEDFTLGELTAQLAQITGKNIVYKQISDDEFIVKSKSPTPRIAQEMLENIKFYQDFGYFGTKDTKPSRQHLARAPRKWADFVKANDWSAFFA
ncbi:NAD(P)-binding protein [Mycena albidolilacea]|uniref:NAD(P)-binding protein n=1 Tax=Mycena albidolilacea TaxID=1033008 RepID=A0AAD7ABG9_9AGAR|nr:NAD(P)-binding protein [Mycena albidolilacea]